jgi:virginiamycin A acetyltransferase
VNVTTCDDFVTADEGSGTVVFRYADGAVSYIPEGFFRDGDDRDIQHLDYTFELGRCALIGAGSTVKYDSGLQKLVVGNYVQGGLRLRFLLNGRHEMRMISTTMFNIMSRPDVAVMAPPVPQYGDMIIGNDVWIGDEVMFLGGSVTENGCVIGARSLVPANFRSEPYGIYAGTPARLLRFRFSDTVIAQLLELAWWEMPLTWIVANNDAFLVDFTQDEDRAVDVLARLAEAKAAAGPDATSQQAAGS